MIFEKKSQPVAGRWTFLRRLLFYWMISAVMIGLSLGFGVLGYRYFAGLPWIDALLNASMILGGMGPVDPLPSDAAKIFASLYALFAGLAFIGVASVIVAPFVHRLLHRIHLDDEE